MKDGAPHEAPVDATAVPSRRRRRWRRVLLGVVAALALLEALWLVGGPWYLDEVLPRTLNDDPVRMTVTWSHGRVSWIPGVFSMRDLHMRRQSNSVQWEWRLDQGRARVSVLPLVLKRFKVTGLDGSGLSFRLRFVPGRGKGAEMGSPNAPPIEGLAPPPLAPGDSAQFPAKGGHWRWSFTLARCAVEDVREIWIGPYRFTGDARVSTTMSATPKQVVSIPRFTIAVGSGQIALGEKTFADGLKGELAASLDRFRMDSEPALDALERLSAEGELAGTLHDVQLPTVRFPNVPWLGFGGGTGRGELAIALRDGAFKDGTRLRLEADAFQVRYPGYVVEGGAAIAGDVAGGKGDVKATFQEFTIKKDGAPTAHIEGEGFSAELWTKDLTLRHPLETYHVELDLPKSEIVDFNAYQDAIPEFLKVDVDGGRGDISGKLVVTESSSNGHIDVDGHDVVLRYQGHDLRTDLVLATKIREADMRQARFDFGGTELHLKNGAVISGGDPRNEGWWADIALPVLTVHRGEKVVARLQADAKFKDTRPLVAIMAADRPLVKLFHPALMAKDVAVTAKLAAGHELVDLDDLKLDGDGLMARACLELTPGEKRGVVFMDSGLLSGGVKFAGGKKNINVIAKEQWYLEAEPLCDDPTHAPPG